MSDEELMSTLVNGRNANEPEGNQSKSLGAVIAAHPLNEWVGSYLIYLCEFLNKAWMTVG